MLSSIHLHARNTIYPSAKCSAGRTRKLKPAALVAAGILLLPSGGHEAARAQKLPRAQPMALQALQKKHNEAALMMLGGSRGATYAGMARDVAGLVNPSADLRVIVVDAPGGMESLRDLLFLRGIDLALVPRNVLDYADATGAFGAGLRERLTYVTALYGEEVHVLAGAGIASIKDLRGRKVAVPPDDANAEFTVRDLLRRFQIEAEVVKAAPPDAIDDVRSGALAAVVMVGGKPLRFVAGLPKDGALHLLALPPTQGSAQPLGDSYSPASFDADDYPTLIAGQTIDTLSVSAILVANKTAPPDESNRRIAKFVSAFFGSLSEPSGLRHPKWSDVNLAASLDRWSRFPAAQEWLNTALRERSAAEQRNFDAFLRAAASGPVPSPAQRKQMFEDYLKWTRSTTDAVR
jgi:TRAP-type uncharacterized transport system substrate-binding protein